MPAGVSVRVYVKHLTVALLAMLAGAQTVHLLYRPLQVTNYMYIYVF